MERDSKKIPCYQDMLIAEIKVYDKTKIAFAKWFRKFEELIDLFLKMLYLKSICSLTDESSTGYTFFYYAQEVYTEVPCALRACSKNLENGYYTDALVSCRTLFETLAKLKYFFDNKESISSYFISGKSIQGKKVRIIDIFEKVSPNAYKKNYAFLSRFTHKGFCTCLPKLASRLNSQNKVNDKQAPFSPIPTFNKCLAEIVIKHLLGIISGYLNAAPYFLSPEIVAANQPFYEKYEKLKSWVNHAIQTNKEDFQNSKEWSELMEEVASEPKIKK